MEVSDSVVQVHPRVYLGDITLGWILEAIQLFTRAAVHPD